MIHVFLVDDHQIVLDGIQAFLQSDPEIQVAGQANDGEQALQRLHSMAQDGNLPDIAILDITMPKMDGIEATRQIKKQFPGLPVILLTMENDSHFIMNAMRLGVKSFIVKEKSKELLIQVIKKVAAGESYFSPDIHAKLVDESFIYGKKETQAVELTQREKEIICLLAKEPELTAEKVAQRLNIATYTVHTHLRNVRSKLDMSKTAQLIHYALEHDLCKDLEIKK